MNLMNIQSAMRLEGTEELEILKIDVDGFEWPVLSSLLEETSLVKEGHVKQLVIEIHVCHV